MEEESLSYICFYARRSYPLFRYVEIKRLLESVIMFFESVGRLKVSQFVIQDDRVHLLFQAGETFGRSLVCEMLADRMAWVVKRWYLKSDDGLLPARLRSELKINPNWQVFDDGFLPERVSDEQERVLIEDRMALCR